jgi:hypothetical protein
MREFERKCTFLLTHIPPVGIEPDTKEDDAELWGVFHGWNSLLAEMRTGPSNPEGRRGESAL